MPSPSPAPSLAATLSSDTLPEKPAPGSRAAVTCSQRVFPQASAPEGRGLLPPPPTSLLKAFFSKMHPTITAKLSRAASPPTAPDTAGKPAPDHCSPLSVMSQCAACALCSSAVLDGRGCFLFFFCAFFFMSS